MFLDRPNINFEEVDFINNDVDEEASVHLSMMVTLTWIEIFFQRKNFSKFRKLSPKNPLFKVIKMQTTQDSEAKGVGSLEKKLQMLGLNGIREQ